MPGHAPKSLGEDFGIAVLAAGADLCATTHRVPGCIRPFDRRCLAHVGLPKEGHLLALSRLEPVREEQLYRKRETASRKQIAPLKLSWAAHFAVAGYPMN